MREVPTQICRMIINYQNPMNALRKQNIMKIKVILILWIIWKILQFTFIIQIKIMNSYLLSHLISRDSSKSGVQILISILIFFTKIFFQYLKIFAKKINQFVDLTQSVKCFNSFWEISNKDKYKNWTPWIWTGKIKVFYVNLPSILSWKQQLINLTD